MEFWTQFVTTFEKNPQLIENILISLLVIFLAWVLRRVFERVATRRLDDETARYQLRKTSGYVFVLLVLLILVPLWLGGVKDIVTYLGLASAGLAIALQGLIVDMVAWVFILLRRPLRVGDRVQIGEQSGDVIDIRIFQFSMIEIGNWVDADQSTGRILNIPNRRIFTDVLANYSTGFQFIWNEIGIQVTFESNWRKAKQILEEISNEYGNTLTERASEQIKKASSKYLIFYKNLTPRVYTTVKDSGVMLTIRYICEPQKRRGSAELIWEAVLDQFAACEDIDLAYPTLRYYDNRAEGKPGAKAGGEPKN